eukprot:1159892-Pelagomonas_calceolata.AAC.34
MPFVDLLKLFALLFQSLAADMLGSSRHADMLGSSRHAWQQQTCLAAADMLGSSRHAWQQQACLAAADMLGSSRHAWQQQTCLAAADKPGSRRHAWQQQACLAAADIWRKHAPRPSRTRAHMLVDHDYSSQDALAAAAATSLQRKGGNSSSGGLNGSSYSNSSEEEPTAGAAAVAAGVSAAQRVMRIILEGSLGRSLRAGAGAAGWALSSSFQNAASSEVRTDSPAVQTGDRWPVLNCSTGQAETKCCTHGCADCNSVLFKGCKGCTADVAEEE